MTPEQLKTIVGLMTGIQAAVVHLCHALEQKGVFNREELAASFEASAKTTPDPLIALPCRQIAAGIRGAHPPAAADDLARLLH